MQLGKLVMVSALAICFAACQQASDDEVYTLYRTSAVSNGSTWRVHVASFDAVDGHDYNMGNCEIARALFQTQPGVDVRYWCEKGHFRK